jgi:RNA polymerase sigma-70 factor (ECF subfamily)
MRPLSEFLREHELTLERLYAASGAGRWRIARADFAAALYRSCARRFTGDDGPPAAAAVESYLGALHVDDLALALACLAGREDAWRELETRYRAGVEGLARAIVRDPVRAQELADSLWGDLFAASRPGDNRRSPLEQYYGRSSLAAWLRTVVARREVDQWRAQRRAQSVIESASREPAISSNGAREPDDPERRRYLEILGPALSAAIRELDARDRLRLSAYYVQELSLAEVAVLTGEHESTVSRNLARVRVEIRRRVERLLRREHGLSDDQIEVCFEYALGDWPFDLVKVLAQEK